LISKNLVRLVKTHQRMSSKSFFSLKEITMTKKNASFLMLRIKLKFSMIFLKRVTKLEMFLLPYTEIEMTKEGKNYPSTKL